MAKEIFIPKLGQTVEEVTLVKWLVPDGAEVDKGQEVLEVETDKAVFTVEAPAKGVLHITQGFGEGQVVPVLTVVALVAKPGEQIAADAGTAFESPAEVPPASAEQAAPAAVPGQPAPADPASGGPEGGRVFASPRARRLAAERAADLRRIRPTGYGGQRVVERDVIAYLTEMPKATPLAQKLAAQAGLDLSQVTPSAQGKRITREDVERALQPGAAPAAAAGRSELPAASAPQASQPAAAAPAEMALPEVSRRVPLTGVRKIIAERMASSVHASARVTLMLQADATEFVAMRDRLKARVTESWGYAPGYNDLLAKVVAQALRHFPYMNARITANAIEQLGHVNMGMAVDTERGLLVPVIRDADRKSLREFGSEFRQMVERARAGRSMPDDLSGGTFTITNLGMYDVEGFTPVINLPEAAILGVGRIAPQWVYRADQPDRPVLRQMWTLSLVFDHRLVDGAPAARFLQHIKNVVEEPYLLLAG